MGDLQILPRQTNRIFISVNVLSQKTIEKNRSFFEWLCKFYGDCLSGFS